MSVDSSIDLRIVQASTRDIISPTKTLTMLISHGWNLIGQNGYIMYLPPKDNDMFDWKDSNMSIASLMKILEEKEQANELIGVGLRWKDTTVGGEVLLRTKQKMLEERSHTSMSFCLTCDRKLLLDNGNFKITDVNWYLERLLPIFNQGDTLVDYFTYQEHI